MKKYILCLVVFIVLLLQAQAQARVLKFDELMSTPSLVSSFDISKDQILFPVVDKNTNTYQAGTVNFHLGNNGNSYPLILKFKDEKLFFKIDNGEGLHPRYNELGSLPIKQGTIHYMNDPRGLLFVIQ